MPIAQSAPQPTGASAALGGGGGGGGLTNEADTVVMRDTDGTYFLRAIVRDAAGANPAVTDYELDGTTVLAPAASVDAVPAFEGSVTPTGGVPVVSRLTVADSPFSTATGRTAVTVIGVVNAGAEVSVEGADWPANFGHTFWSPRQLQPPIDLILSGTGEALVIEEVA